MKAEVNSSQTKLSICTASIEHSDVHCQDATRMLLWSRTSHAIQFILKLNLV